MSTVIKDLGAVSAYAYAVEKGYTGTEEEFAELMADYAAVGQRAEDAAESALNSKTAAQTAATTATNKASEATTAAQTATTKAGEASQSASQAQASAQTASTKASEASTSAQTASAKASEASQSATTASNKASEASGYATSASQAKTDAESARDSAQGYASDAQGYANDAQASAESISASQIAKNASDILKAFPTDTASGAVASFSDGADNIPLKSLIVNIDPVQDTSSGDPSPENICPISGWTAMTVNATNDNLICDSLPSDYFVCGALQTGDTTIPSGSTYRAYCVYVGKNAKIGYRKEVNPSTTLNLGLAFADVYLTSQTGSVIYDALNMTNRSNNVLNSGEHPYLVIVVLNSNINNKTYNARKAYVFPNNNGRTVSFSPQRNIDKYAIDWSSETGTVYGGQLNVLTGILTVYPYYASYNGETLTGRWISDRDVYAVGTTPTIGAQVVNIGAEGTEYQLEPHEVASLLGQNNIWADTGDCSVEYRADTTLYISRLTEPDADMIADSNIVSGQYFMVGNSLFKATANIASGSAVIVGTNATRKSLSEALNEINA